MASSSGSDAHEAQRASPPSFHDGSLSHDVTSVKLTCGQTFTVHTDLLCYWSPNLLIMLKGKTKELKLDLDVKIFQIILHWLYTRELRGLLDYVGPHRPIIISVGGSEQLQDPERYYRERRQYHALETYIFATMYDMKALRNDIVEAIHNHGPPKVVSYAVVLHAYRHLPSTSMLLTYFVDVYAKYYTEDLDCNNRSELILRKQLPTEFLMSWVLKAMDRDFDGKKLRLKDYLEPTE